MHIIAICGKAEAGKTTAANYLKHLAEEAGFSAAVVSYGTLLKDICKHIYGWDGQKNEAGRSLLQRVGTDTIRKRNPYFFTNYLVKLADVLSGEFDLWIIDDVRFPNEFACWEYSTEHTLTTLRVERPGHENALTAEQRQHPSETALDGATTRYTAKATTQEELFKQCYIMFELIKGSI